MIENLAIGLNAILNPTSMFVIVLGVVIGIVLGTIPGISVTMTIALFLPVSFTMDPLNGIMLLVGMYIGATSGGLIPSILLNMPGTPANVGTCFDGYPMTKNGQAMKALGIGLVVSFVGTLASVIMMILLSVPLARFALGFGPFEYFAIAMFSLSLLCSLAGKSILIGIATGLFGMIISSVGMAPIDAVTRFNFGTWQLSGGLDVLPVLVGMFALAEIMVNAEKSRKLSKEPAAVIDTKSVKGFGFTGQEFKQQIPNLTRSTGLGLGLGLLPGISATTINLLAYSLAKSSSKYPEKFGTGIMDGVVATESSNSAAIGGAMVPLMTLGIPGDMATAILLGGFMIHGLQPGPLLFVQETALVYGIFVSMAIASFVMLIAQFYGIRLFIKVLKVPRYILLPIIFTMCVVGAFGVNHRIFDTFVVIFFGIIGYFFVKAKLPVGPFIMGFILGPMVETFFRRALMLSQGDYAPFLTRPVSGLFLAGTVIYLVVLTISRYRARAKAKAAASA
ncbi:MAG: tripartite tricarboxylate transporter permease [Oscillospiraceae bacterium]|nr:tripartite tricarboxylate transporter permease [Oscillospiraceae bacterium]